jgi:nucleoside-diphosphate-sugar epimerase
MTRVAVLGANGQVGAELCLVLGNHDGVEVVPVSRNRFGSAFLRYYGVACRHGRVTDPGEARELIGDCSVIVNLALSMGRGLPRVARRENRELIRTSIECSAPGARIIYCSTRAIYGDPTAGARIRWKSSYGQEKLKCERDALRFGRRAGKDVFVLRLGHVCGELQGLSALVRRQIAAGPIVIPQRDGHSDTVYTATIADAVLKVAAGGGTPGTFDLTCRPQWTWREVYEHEAQAAGLPVEIRRQAAAPPSGTGGGLAALIRLGARFVRAKELGLRLAARLSPAWNQRLQVLNGLNRARAEIVALTREELTLPSMTQVAFGRTFPDFLERTADIVRRQEFRIPSRDPARSWPEDLARPKPRAPHGG